VRLGVLLAQFNQLSGNRGNFLGKHFLLLVCCRGKISELNYATKAIQPAGCNSVLLTSLTCAEDFFLDSLSVRLVSAAQMSRLCFSTIVHDDSSPVIFVRRRRFGVFEETKMAVSAIISYLVIITELCGDTGISSR